MEKPIEPSADVTRGSKPLSLREYAKHRGVSAPSVMRAIRGGRLRACLVIGADKKPKIGDVALADQEWTANTDLSKAPAYVKERSAARADEPREDASEDAEPFLPGSMSLTDASALEKEWRAKLAELDYKRKSAELVNAAELEAHLVDVFTQIKTKLLALPSALKAGNPNLTHRDVVFVDGKVRELLEDLATLSVRADGSAAA